MSRVLIVDDEQAICWGFREFLSEDGHEVDIAASAEEALQVVDEHVPDAIVLDVRLPGMDGLTAIEQLRDRIGNVPIVVITAFGNLETAVKAVEQGAFDYLPKPFDLDQATEIVNRALEANQPAEETTTEPETTSSETLIGSSPAMQEVFKQIALVAASEVPVLITGESGTGKELVARAIHQHSPRRNELFLPVCLAALSGGLVESELFGHVKGSFTGANSDRAGLLELADQGTVFLDEIADTESALQVKLLRAVEQQEITPVGDPRPRPINARIVAATNRPLGELMERGEFREDLYFRLSVFHIHLPALRDRLNDLPLLAAHFLNRFRPGSLHNTLSEEVLQALRQRTWSGNVRELRNVIEHAALLSRNNIIRVEHLPAADHRPGNLTSAESLNDFVTNWVTEQLEESPDKPEQNFYEEFLHLIEPPLLQAFLTHCDNNRAAAAQLLGIHRTTLRQKLRRYDLEPE